MKASVRWGKTAILMIFFLQFWTRFLIWKTSEVIFNQMYGSCTMPIIVWRTWTSKVVRSRSSFFGRLVKQKISSNVKKFYWPFVWYSIYIHGNHDFYDTAQAFSWAGWSSWCWKKHSSTWSSQTYKQTLARESFFLWLSGSTSRCCYCGSHGWFSSLPIWTRRNGG